MLTPMTRCTGVHRYIISVAEFNVKDAFDWLPFYRVPSVLLAAHCGCNIALAAFRNVYFGLAGSAISLPALFVYTHANVQIKMPNSWTRWHTLQSLVLLEEAGNAYVCQPQAFAPVTHAKQAQSRPPSNVG